MTSKVVLVTGAARRLGHAIARDFGGRGWSVGVHYRRSQHEAEGLVAEIVAGGGIAVALQADLSDWTALEALLPRCREALGPVTCLLNNASEFRCDTIANVEPDSWRTHFDVNVRAPVCLARALAGNLPEGSQGSVINIIDQRVLRPTPEFFSYTLSKTTLWTATQTLAQALAPRVRVNAIAPGPVLQSIHQSEEAFRAECRSTLLGRGVSLAEIAAAVQFVLAAEAMTGQLIAIDGGQHLT